MSDRKPEPYSPPSYFAGTCSHCGAAVGDMPAHSMWHAMLYTVLLRTWPEAERRRDIDESRAPGAIA